MSLTNLNTLINASAQNTSQFKGLSAAYGILLGGAPTIDGYTTLINTNNSTNFGAGASGPTFNDENIYINTINALYQGNATAKANFDAIVSSAATIQDALTLVYNYVIPASARTEAGLNYFKSQASFYAGRAAELGVAGTNGTALVAFASLTKIAVDNDIGGLGDTINDLRAAVANGTAQIPQSGNVFTPLETADGTQFDADDAPGGGSNQGSTFTLTTAADNVLGTGGNDTINGVVTTTFQLTDAIDGGAGTDTLNIAAEIAAADVALPGASIKNVEIINARVLTSDGVVSNKLTIDASLTPNVTQIWSDRSTEKLAVTNLATGAMIGIRGDGVITNQNVDYAYATATTAQMIGIDGGTKAGNITATASTGVTTATITSTGAANTVGTIKLDSAGAGTVTSLTVDAATNLTATLTAADYAATAALVVKGAAAKVDLGATYNGKTIDASGLTAGGLTIALGTNTTSFKGGQGNDTVTSAAVGTTTAGAIDAGAGTGDRLVNAVATNIDSAAEGALYTNFEIFRNGAAATQDASLVAGITAVETSASGAGFNKMTAGQAAAVTNLVDNAGATFALTTATGTSDVLSVTLANATATASADLTTATVTGFETMNVVSSSGSSTDINALSFAAAGNLTALNLSGAKPISVSTTNITKGAAISAAGLTYVGATATDYALTLSGNLVKGSSVTGSGAADSLTTTAAITGTAGDFVTYDAGAGNDAISSTAAAINNASGANGSLKIEGGAGTDTLTLTDGASLTLVDANFQYITGVEKISYAVANKAIAITSGGFFDTNFKTGGVTFTLGDATNAQVNTVDLTSFTGAATVSLNASAATTQAQTITTGSGADTVTLLVAGTTTGAHTISTGAGNDTIKVTIDGTTITSGSVTINAGAGKDAITITGDSTANADTAVNTIVKVQEGHSTLVDFDTITGAVLSAAGAKQAFQLDFDGTASANVDVAASSVTGYTSGELTYTVTNGLLAFAGTAAATLTAAQKATIAQTVIIAADKAVAFVDGTDSYVFHNGATTDSLVKLAGVTLLGIDAATAGYIDIA